VKRSVVLIAGGVVIVLLVGALVLVKHLPKKTAPTAAVITISKVDTAKIDTITLDHGGQTVTLKQAGKTFDVQYPYTVAWDPNSISQIASSFANLDADRLLSKNPTDLAQYGLSPVQATATANLSDGSNVVIEIGNKTPSGNDYYVMKKGDPALYTVPTYSISPLLSSTDSLRDKNLPSIDTQKLTYFEVTNAGKTIKIIPIPKGDSISNVSFASFQVVEPYKVPRPADADKLSTLLKSFPSYLQVQKFISDRPTDLAKYGLSPAKAHIVLKDDKSVLDIYLGNQLPDGTMYAKLADKPSVFTVNYSDFKALLDANLFNLTDKFLLIPNIADVASFTITAPGATYDAKIVTTTEKLSGTAGAADSSQAPTTKSTYYLNGKTIEESAFKNFYQTVIGLLADAPNPDPSIAFKPEISVTFHLTKGTPNTYSEYLVPYNRDFYAVFRNGVSDMLLDRAQVAKMLNSAAEVMAGKKPTP